MEEKINTIQSLIGVLNSPIAQRKGVTMSPEHCKIWVEELTKFMQEHGWHPVSEPPKVGEDGDVEVIVIHDNNDVNKAIYCEIEGIGMWDLPNIEWWCYLPGKEN